ncbi:MAG TPA: efflux transporter periplasmic adaptor subunit, partial [Verrucomicrobiae bacterium]|nr:efflux transporter periplasmic adaptor subunit [Verrucomicrobiae bacterium]
NTVAYRQVQLGPRVNGRRVVRSGLNGNEAIVVNGLQRVRPGMEVQPQTETAAGTPNPLARR